MKKIYINDTNCVSPLGFNRNDNWKAIKKGETGIALVSGLGNLPDFYAATIEEIKLNQAFLDLQIEDKDYTRLEKMLFIALDPLMRTNGLRADTALIISTTKGNIEFLKGNQPLQADINILAEKIANHYGFTTAPIIVSNACVSGVLALAVSKRLLQMDQFSDAYVLAGDVISEFVVSGFSSFQAMSHSACKPYDQNRTGVSLGEAAAAVYVSSVKGSRAIEILGEATIADANHISGPSRTGEGLYQSVLRAFLEAGIENQSVDMISAHGTATLFNDEMEAIALNRLGMQHIPLHSLKGYYGHTLGASGLLETVMAVEAMDADTLIVCKGFELSGTSEKLNITTKAAQQKIHRVLKTASGFGGTNSAIVLEKAY